MNPDEKLKSLLTEATTLQAKIKDNKADDADYTRVDELTGEIKDVRGKIDSANRFAAEFKAAGALQAGKDTKGNQDPAPDVTQAATLGEFVVKSLGEDGFKRLKGGSTVTAPVFKAASDAHTTPQELVSGFLTTYDPNIVHGYRRPLVTSLLGTGAVSGTSITYFVESATVEGGFANVKEGAQKPQLHIADPTPVTDNVHKIAAWFAVSDEMTTDLPFWQSEIDQRGLYLLGLYEEDQLLNGDGTGDNILGLLKRPGIQTEAVDTTSGSKDTPADAIFRAGTDIRTARGLEPDGLILNPADYQAIRLAKDANGQYFAGGPWSGAYGMGSVTAPQSAATYPSTIPNSPSLWGIPTIVSPAVAKGTAVVGAFRVAATVYRKNGLQTKLDPYTLMTANQIRTVIEERLALAVRLPAAIVTVDLGTAGTTTPGK
ncbi:MULTISPECIES: phage major capsid protein [Bifidobacterium]|jgi:HK97 family phage major capsid protein|uniref:Phage major capsid protein n=1 Tax=Bifidobacterium tibiigranuli TaxID=2172043 RepID=A0A5N6SAL5_9BIFI|nr:phage major capsid protein [Bifidobacterium tibiigranuli]KAE8130218.1 phage major capsid protein [Bifidobacterium tibiigranuli]KAE8130423.1 phage major capsid protein [Bifidobacterium tibiigranuli]MCI1212096.1 phage major capsid protein [Bifidobacterium tibiigranuli]